MAGDLTQAIGVLFADRGCSVLLYPPEPYPDGHGYHHRVDLVADAFQGTIDATSYENVRTLLRFHAELLELYHSLKGEAHLSGGYENFVLDFKGDGQGHITVHVEASAGASMDIRFSFNFIIDQTQLHTAITSLAKHLPPLVN
jgi:hypothetical protein